MRKQTDVSIRLVKAQPKQTTSRRLVSMILGLLGLSRMRTGDLGMSR